MSVFQDYWIVILKYEASKIIERFASDLNIFWCPNRSTNNIEPD